MDDKDHVFARFKDNNPVSPDRRETLTIPRRGGTAGSRSVEVVHVRSGGAARDRVQRPDPYARAASWDGAFPTKTMPPSSMPIEPVTPAITQPLPPVMSEEEPAAAEAEPAVPARPEQPVVAVHQGRGRPRKAAIAVTTRRVADPFDPSDFGANCIRCGYAIEAARDQRGMMTCSGCG
jgi:hypothetical protein